MERNHEDYENKVVVAIQEISLKLHCVQVLPMLQGRLYYTRLDCVLYPYDPLYNHEDKVVAATHEISTTTQGISYKFYQCYRGVSVTAQLLSQQSSNQLLTKALL